MSKSNNNHCTPDLFGEQKGEISPFFHIYKKEELEKILLKSEPELTFISEEDLKTFSTFFHKERQTLFLKKAAEASSDRQKLAEEIFTHIHSLASATTELAKTLSTQAKKETSLSKNCALLTDLVLEKEEDIRTNILVWINNQILHLNSDSTFLQIKKELFFLEEATKLLDTYPEDREETKSKLLQYPPQALISLLSRATQYYSDTERFLASQLLLAAKAAKAQNAAKYMNLLHGITVRLYDTARLLKAIGTEV